MALLPVTPPKTTLRVAIAGGPCCGKSTLAERMRGRVDAPEVQHTDDLVDVLQWSEASAEVATWFTADGPFIVEGVAVSRALRKWLAANPTGKPCDVLYHLTNPFLARTPGQKTMAKGEDTVWDEIAPELRARGVELRFTVEA